MSYTELIPFRDGMPQRGIEFRNSWGGAARIWNALYDKYCKRGEYDTWLVPNDAQKLWNLVNDDRLSDAEKSVLAFTFDRFYVRKENFHEFAKHLREFVEMYPAGSCVDHLPAWADWIENSVDEAVGLYATSVGENVWRRFDEEKDEMVSLPLSQGREVYDELNEPA